jgi:hypothetical protein
MAGSVTLVVVTGSQSFSPGTVGGLYRFTVNGEVQDVAEPTAVFPLPAPGTYVALCVRLDAAGTPIGSPVSASFEVPTDVAVDVPVSITVSLSFT